jgi:glucosamine-6-phosphate deaminase
MNRPRSTRRLMVEKLSVKVYATRDDMGRAAACDVAERMQQLLATQARVRMVFAAAPSQNEFLATLSTLSGLDWSRVEAFHMDEYLGLPPGASQGFGLFLRERLFARVKPGRVEYIDGAADPQDECTRYGALVQERPVDIVCAGVGENGHMAFNDPPVADFADPYTVKVVTLDEVCRMQQVHDGAFPSFDAVPQSALTLTIPALMSARWLYSIVPGPTKTVAVRKTLQDPIATACPATIMRHHPCAVLYLDRDSAAQI